MFMTQGLLIALLGGAIIGLSATLLLATLGRVAGVSGIVANLVSLRRSGEAWQLGFVLGLLTVGWLLLGRNGQSAVTSVPTVTIFAGLLVGFGARLGNGCTSGHGVCGLSRFSARSLVATLTFMVSAMIVVFVVRHGFGGGVR